VSRHLWVVEMQEDGQWWPTVGVSLTRDDARRDHAQWERDNPDDSFRVRKYAPTSTGEKGPR